MRNAVDCMCVHVYAQTHARAANTDACISGMFFYLCMQTCAHAYAYASCICTSTYIHECAGVCLYVYVFVYVYVNVNVYMYLYMYFRYTVDCMWVSVYAQTHARAANADACIFCHVFFDLWSER